MGKKIEIEFIPKKRVYNKWGVYSTKFAPELAITMKNNLPIKELSKIYIEDWGNCEISEVITKAKEEESYVCYLNKVIKSVLNKRHEYLFNIYEESDIDSDLLSFHVFLDLCNSETCKYQIPIESKKQFRKFKNELNKIFALAEKDFYIIEPEDFSTNYLSVGVGSSEISRTLNDLRESNNQLKSENDYLEYENGRLKYEVEELKKKKTFLEKIKNLFN